MAQTFRRHFLPTGQSVVVWVERHGMPMFQLEGTDATITGIDVLELARIARDEFEKQTIGETGGSQIGLAPEGEAKSSGIRGSSEGGPPVLTKGGGSQVEGSSPPDASGPRSRAVASGGPTLTKGGDSGHSECLHGVPMSEPCEECENTAPGHRAAFPHPPAPLVERLADELSWWLNWGRGSEEDIRPPRSFRAAVRAAMKLIGEVDPRRVGK